jgi:hypothetical protein
MYHNTMCTVITLSDTSHTCCITLFALTQGPTQERTMYNITMKAVDFPASLRVSSKAKAFMRSLLRQRVEFRLGSNCGITEIMSNPWFEGIDWTTVPGFDPELMPPIGAQAGTPSAGAGASAPGQ